MSVIEIEIVLTKLINNIENYLKLGIINKLMLLYKDYHVPSKLTFYGS